MESKIQELEQAEKAIYAGIIAAKFEEILDKTAAGYGMRREDLDFNPIELQSTIINKQLLNDDYKLQKYLYVAAKKLV